MFNRRAVMVLAGSAGLLLAVGLPARAASNLVQKKTVAGPNGRSGTILRFSDQGGNSVTLSTIPRSRTSTGTPACS
jgi:hypothetical protein